VPALQALRLTHALEHRRSPSLPSFGTSVDWSPRPLLAAELLAIVRVGESASTPPEKQPFGGALMAAWQFGLDVFRRPGLPALDAMKAFHAFGGYIMGNVTMELGTMV
jgi:hypothetical protein